MTPHDSATSGITPVPAPRRGGVGRRILLSCLTTVVLLLLLEGGMSLVLAAVDADDGGGLAEEAHCVFDPELGWVNERGRHIQDLYGPHRHLTTNARGFRGTAELGDAVPDDRFRVICLGDSFTLGYGVDDSDTYPALLEERVPAIETVNMGQGGYGIDQCYLWYRRDAAGLQADLLLFAFIAPDFERMLEARFNGLYPKPVLRVEGGRLVLPTEPLPDDWDAGSGTRRLRHFVRGLRTVQVMDRLGRRRRWAERGAAGGEPPAPDPLPFAAVGEHTIRALVELARERGQDIALAHIPLRDRRAGHPRAVVEWLAPIAAELGVTFLDLTPDFDALPAGELDFHYQEDGHLNSHGNRFLAAILHRRLADRLPEPPRR